MVIDPDLIETMDLAAVGSSVKAMIEANVLRLPFNQMILECTFNDLPDETFFVLINDRTVVVASYYAEQACVYPTKFDYHAEASGKGSAIQMKFQDAFLNIPVDSDLAVKIDEYIGKVVGRLLGVAFVVTNIQGVDREVVECEALNKQREKKGKVPIPQYTYLRIGHYYKSNGERENYVSGRSGKIHMRRGHIRNQACGEGLKDRKLIYIEPVLVNYRDANQPPPQIKVKW